MILCGKYVLLQVFTTIRFSLLFYLDVCLHSREFGKATPRLGTERGENLQGVPYLQSRNT